MELPRLPAEIYANWTSWWSDQDTDQMRAKTEARFSEAFAAWGLSEPELLDGGAVALTAGARQKERKVVIKALPSPEGEDLGIEARGLAHWQFNRSVVDLIDQRDDGLTLLMERIEPGQSLEELLPFELAIDPLGQAARSLAADGPASEELEIPLLAESQFADHWRASLEGRDELTELEELLDAPPTSVIHLDLHTSNVLAGQSNWTVIDPKPHLADPHAECMPLLATFYSEKTEADQMTPRTKRLLRRYASAAGLDAAELARWTRVRAVADSLSVEDPRWIAHLDSLAAAIAELEAGGDL